jgi:hypothetical protein
MEETLTTRPSLRSIMPRSTRWVTRNVPVMLIRNTRSQASSVSSMNSVGELMPARFASATMGGMLASTSSMAAFTVAWSETSAPTPLASTPYTEEMSSAARRAASPSISRMATDQPSLASISAVARPMPRAEAAPVSTAVRSAGNVSWCVISVISSSVLVRQYLVSSNSSAATASSPTAACVPGFTCPSGRRRAYK